MKTEVPTIEFATRPLKVNGKILTTAELAWFGRAAIVAASQGVPIDKIFIEDFVKYKILIYTNPANVDFGEYTINDVDEKPSKN